MFFGVFSALSIIVGLASLFIAFILLKRFSWIFGWLKGTLGLCFLGLAGVMCVVNLDLLSYQHMLEEESVVTLSFERITEQKYQATLVYVKEGRQERYEIFGDQWQIDVRVIRWSGLFEAFGVKPGYRFDRLSGRYFTLEDERAKPRSIHQLKTSEYPVDLWSWLKQNNGLVPWVEAAYGSATYLPMSDGAIFDVSMSYSGLSAVPVNQAAKNAVNQFL